MSLWQLSALRLRLRAATGLYAAIFFMALRFAPRHKKGFPLPSLLRYDSAFVPIYPYAISSVRHSFPTTTYHLPNNESVKKC